MKLLFLVMALIVVDSLAFAEASDPFRFIKNFKLISAKFTEDGKRLEVAIDAPVFPGTPVEIQLSPLKPCSKSIPAQCTGTLVRLDQAFGDGEVKRLVVTFKKVQETFGFYPMGLEVTIVGPNKSITVRKEE